MNCPVCGHNTPKRPSSQKNREFASDSREMRAARFLFAEIRKTVPEMKEPNWQGWARDFDAIFRIDKYEAKQVKDVILFARADSFWSVNILSPKTLRKQFVKLLAKMRAQSPSSEPPKRMYQEQARKTE